MRDGAVYCRAHYELILQSEAEMEAVVAAATAASEAEAGIIPNVAKPNRKTSNFLTVEDNFQHLTIHEVLSE